MDRSGRARGRRLPAWAVLSITGLLFAPRGADGQRRVGVVVGTVVDATTSAPLAATQLVLGRVSVTTSRDGAFAIARMAADEGVLAVRRIGYAPVLVTLDTLRPFSGDSARVRIAMRETALTLAAVTVRAPIAAATGQAVVLDGAALDRALAPSIAATIAGEPGVTVRTNGPMAAQPVIRGLSGDRVAVLEDGLRTGDIATTAPDHAVTIDPITARRIEIVRGPAGLRYGSNVLGGIINVVRDDVPKDRPDRLTGQVGMQGESVNRGGVTGGGVTAPVGPAIVRLTGAVRTGGDTRTPTATLPFTDLDGFDVGIGASVGSERTRVGVAVRDARSFYGVPSSHAGLTLPGSHDGGVYVDLQRSTARVEGEWRRDSVEHATGLSAITVSAQGIRFYQEELERGGFVGTTFGQLALNGEAVVRYRRGGRVPGEGSVGITTQWRDFRAEGSFTGTRPAVVNGRALFAHELIRLGRLDLSIGTRVDQVTVRPLDSTETRLLRDVRTRNFGAMTGAMAATWHLRPSLSVGGTVARAFRPPAVEELFSAGPHLATYGYEVGNPRLAPERGWGSDLLVRVTRPRLVTEVSAYRMWIDGLVYQSPQLDPSTGGPLLDPRLRRYQVYQSAQTRALLTGAEGRLQWELRRGWALDATGALVSGVRRDADDAAGVGAGSPLPAMPPARGRVQLRRDGSRWLAGATIEGALAQRRVPAPAGQTAACTSIDQADGVLRGLRPAEFCPTNGFALLHLTSGRRWVVGRQLHALTLTIDNLLNADWRDHLWRAKQVAPQPGRNLRLLYRVSL
jgi:iron complex outermembrane recepter protein